MLSRILPAAGLICVTSNLYNDNNMIDYIQKIRHDRYESIYDDMNTSLYQITNIENDNIIEDLIYSGSSTEEIIERKTPDENKIQNIIKNIDDQMTRIRTIDHHIDKIETMDTFRSYLVKYHFDCNTSFDDDYKYNNKTLNTGIILPAVYLLIRPRCAIGQLLYSIAVLCLFGYDGHVYMKQKLTSKKTADYYCGQNLYSSAMDIHEKIMVDIAECIYG